MKYSIILYFPFFVYLNYYLLSYLNHICHSIVICYYATHLLRYEGLTVTEFYCNSCLRLISTNNSILCKIIYKLLSYSHKLFFFFKKKKNL